MSSGNFSADCSAIFGSGFEVKAANQAIFQNSSFLEANKGKLLVITAIALLAIGTAVTGGLLLQHSHTLGSSLIFGGGLLVLGSIIGMLGLYNRHRSLKNSYAEETEKEKKAENNIQYLSIEQIGLSKEQTESAAKLWNQVMESKDSQHGKVELDVGGDDWYLTIRSGNGRAKYLIVHDQYGLALERPVKREGATNQFESQLIWKELAPYADSDRAYFPLGFQDLMVTAVKAAENNGVAGIEVEKQAYYAAFGKLFPEN